MFKRDYGFKEITENNVWNSKHYYLTYDEVVKAKESVQKWVDEKLDSDWSYVKLANEISHLTVPERVVIACSEFADTHYGWQFFMPSTKEVMEFEISDIDSETLEGGVILYISSSVTEGAENCFFTEERTNKITMGSYRKEEK